MEAKIEIWKLGKRIESLGTSIVPPVGSLIYLDSEYQPLIVTDIAYKITEDRLGTGLTAIVHVK